MISNVCDDGVLVARFISEYTFYVILLVTLLSYPTYFPCCYQYTISCIKGRIRKNSPAECTDINHI